MCARTWRFSRRPSICNSARTTTNSTTTVQFLDASQAVFSGLRTLLDDQVAADRRPAAVVRLRKYAGVEPGFKPFTDVLKQRMMEQMAKPGVVYPSTNEMEAELGRDKSYVDGIGALFAKYELTGWREPFARLQQELAGYDTWVRATVMPKAQPNSRMTPEQYAFSLESYGVDLPPAQLEAQAHAAFTEIQAEMAPIAAEVAKQHGWASSDYRDVLRQLKKTQIAGDAILPFYQARLKAIEEIVVGEGPRLAARLSCGPASRHRGRDRADACSAYAPSAVAARPRPEGGVCTAAESSFAHRRCSGQARRLHLRRNGVADDSA